MAQTPTWEDTVAVDENVPSFDDTLPIEETDVELEAKAIASGLSKGTTLGFAPEIYGATQAPVGAYKSLLNVLYKPLGVGEYTGEDVSAYEAAKGGYKTEQERLGEAAPVASTVGEVAGSILPMHQIGKAVSLPSQIGKTFSRRALEGSAIGGITEAIKGVGEEKTLPETAESVTAGLAAGPVIEAGLGVGKTALSGLGKLGSFIAKTKPVASRIEGFVEGWKTPGLLGEEAQGKQAEKLTTFVKDIIKKVGGANKKAIGLYDEVINATEKRIPSKDKLDELLNRAKQLPEDYDQQIEDKKALIQLLENKLLGKETELVVPTITKGTEKVVPATAGSRAKLESEAARLSEQSRLSGENATYDIVETTGPQGEKYNSLIKRTREVSSEQPERMVPVKTEEGGISEFKLQKGEKVEAPGAPEATPSEQLKEGIKVKTVPFEAPTPEFTAEVPAQEAFQTVKTRVGAAEELSARDLHELAKQVSSAVSGMKDKYTKSQAIEITKSLEKFAKEKIPGLQRADEVYHAVDQARKLIGLTPGSKFKPSIKNALPLINRLKNIESSTAGGETSSAVIKDLVDQVKKFDPQLARQIETEGGELASKYDFIKRLNKEQGGYSKFSPPAVLGGAIGAATGGPTGALLGYGVGHQIGSPKAAYVAGGLVKKAVENTPEGLKTIANVLSTGGKSSLYLADLVSKASKKDDIGRNAAMFSLEQNPEFRKLLKKEEPKE